MSEQREIQMMHVVYADGVRYSALSLEEKSQFDELLAEVVESLPHAGLVVAKVDNGDGFALAFTGDPIVVLETAWHLLNQFLASPFLIRLGVHTGVGYLRTSLAGPPTLSGNCIEVAQRMMTWSDGRDVIGSEAFRQICMGANLLTEAQFSLPMMNVDKHGTIRTAYRCYEQPMPKCLLLADGPDEHASMVLNRMAQDIDVQLPESDEHRALLLSQVSLVDKILLFPSANKWASLIGSTQSDRVLAIDTGEAFFEPGPYKVFELTGKRLALERLRAEIVGDKPEISASVPVPLRSSFYVMRSADQELRLAIDRQDSVILLKAPRKYGKTSAIVRAIDHAEKRGLRVFVLDISAADEDDLESAEDFYKWLIAQIFIQLQPGLGIPSWEDWLGPNSNLENAIRHFLSESMAGTLIVFDGVDRLFESAFRDDFFGLLRSWHNRRAFHNEEFWSSLSLLLSYSVEGQSLVSDVNQSPFNVGTHLELKPFTRRDTIDLAGLARSAENSAIYEAACGHPLLTVHLLAHGKDSIPSFVERTIAKVARDHRLQKASRELLETGRTEDQASVWRLVAMGLFVADADGLRPMNPVFEKMLRG